LFGSIRNGNTTRTHGKTARRRKGYYRSSRPGRGTSRRPVIRSTLFTAPRPLPACRSRIRFARNGILAKVAFPPFGGRGARTTLPTPRAYQQSRLSDDAASAVASVGRWAATIFAAAAVALAAPRSRAADPQPYTVSLEKTGNDALDQALHDSSNLVSLRETAPAGPFALVERARGDTGRFVAALHSLAITKAASTFLSPVMDCRTAISAIC